MHLGISGVHRTRRHYHRAFPHARSYRCVHTHFPLLLPFALQPPLLSTEPSNTQTRKPPQSRPVGAVIPPKPHNLSLSLSIPRRRQSRKDSLHPVSSPLGHHPNLTNVQVLEAQQSSHFLALEPAGQLPVVVLERGVEQRAEGKLWEATGGKFLLDEVWQTHLDARRSQRM